MREMSFHTKGEWSPHLSWATSLVGILLLGCAPGWAAECDPEGPFGVPGLRLPPDQIGEWGPVEVWPVQATHMTLLDTGKVLFWRDVHANEFINEPMTTYLWDPVTDTLGTQQTPSSDLFCAGHATLADGRVIAIGGTLLGDDAFGIPDTNVFDPQSETWTRMADMAYGRWYPTATTLPDGRILALSGRIVPGVTATIPEVYDLELDTWTELSLDGDPSLTNLYPMNFVLPDGKVFTAGPSRFTLTLDIDQLMLSPYYLSNWNNGTGSAVYYGPGKVMKCCGLPSSSVTVVNDQTDVIDMTHPTPVWSATAPTAYERGWTDLVLLPDGKVLLVGGATATGWASECAVHAAELWDPDTETWSTMASTARPRMYHASSLLLADGRVLTAGGENSGPPAGGEENFEIYSPPYLFMGPRPTVAWAPSAVGYQAVFQVDTPDAESIDSISLVRPGSVTHSFDENQRWLQLAFQTSGDQLEVTAPADAGLAPPGQYMLFLLNESGVPSVAHFVLLGSCTSTEEPESSCRDGVDNDCDGLGDIADPDCGTPPLPFSPSGDVPSGGGEPLTIGKAPGERITLSWGPSCSAEDVDYSVYEGVIGDFTSHGALFCSTNGATTRTFGRLGDNYYLVVPHTAVREGSYGVDSENQERAAGTDVCLPQELGACR